MFSLWLFLITAAAATAHQPLLPQPQELRYGNTSLRLAHIQIRLAAAPSVEDRFAANELSSRLSAITHSPVPISSAAIGPPAISLIRTGDVAPLPLSDEPAGRNSRESYTLKVTPSGAEIRGRSSAGLYYGVQTLLQMVEGEGNSAALPEVQVRDWPSLAYRGFMMDFSHGQLLRLSEIKRQLDQLARFKANQYYFYSEGAIELDGYSIVNPDARYTREELQEIIRYARERHVDVVPCLELYGHLHDIFRMEKFADVALPRYGREFDPRNPRAVETLMSLVDQTAALFPSAWYHVGFDEPWALGKIGVTPGLNPFETYMSILARVATKAREHGKRLMFWADVVTGGRIFSNHPELVAHIPKGAIAVPWDYEDRPDFGPSLEPLAKSHVATVVATGVWNWNEVFPDYHRTVKNINGFVAEGRKRGSLGILNTGWTDSAQTIYRQSLPGIAMGAVAGWQSEPVDGAAFPGEYARQVFPPATAADVATAFEELSSAEEIFEKALGGSTIQSLWADPLEPGRLARMETRRDDLRKARLLAESADERLQDALRKRGDPALLNGLLLAARIFDYLGMKCLYAIEWAGYFRELKENPNQELASLYFGNQIAAQDHGMAADLLDAVTGLRERYREAWLEESTPYRLGSALARWDAEAEYWRGVQMRAGHLRRTAPMPSIDTLRPQSAAVSGAAGRKNEMESTRRSFMERAAAVSVAWPFVKPYASAGQSVGKHAMPDLIVNYPSMVDADGRLRLDFGPEGVVLDDGLQPSMLCTRSNAVIVQAQLPEEAPPGGRMHYPSVLATALSRDGGATWARISDHDSLNIEGGLTQLRDGTIFALDTYITPGKKEGQGAGQLYTSRNDWRSVQGPRDISFELPGIDFYASTDDRGRPYEAARLHRRILELPNGDLLATVYGTMKGDRTPSTYQPKMIKTRVMLVRSTDGGLHWKLVSTIAVDPAVGTEGFGEPVLARISRGARRGRLICFMRTGRELYESVSDDGGSSWSPARPRVFAGLDINRTELWVDMFRNVRGRSGRLLNEDNAGELRGAVVDPDLIEMRSGMLAAAFGIRIPQKLSWPHYRHPWNGNYLAFSRDQGATWSNVVRMTSGVPTTNYMAIEETPADGELFVTYDIGFWGHPRRYICGRRVSVSIKETPTRSERTALPPSR